MRISEVMVKDPVTIEGSATIVEAARKMREANVGVLPVVEQGTVRGVLTDRDLVVRAVAQESDPRTTRVEDCATVEPVLAHPDWDAEQAMDLMARHRIGRLPVVDAQNRPVGIVTLSSLALRTREDEEALTVAKEVSRRSARGGRAPATERPAGRGGAGRATRTQGKPGAARSRRGSARAEGGKRRLKRAS